jgi:hypothetical protein
MNTNANRKAKDLALRGGGLFVLSLKIVFAVALGGLAIADKNTRFLTSNPGKVIGEALVVGAGSALAFYLIGRNRGATGLVKISLLAFGIFFAVHFLLELSGFNEIEETTGSKKLSEATAKAKKSIIGKGLVFFVILLLLMFTLCGWDSPFIGNPPAADGWKIPGLKGFMAEGTVFALCSALPFIMIVKDRGGHNAEALKEFIKYFILFFGGHVGLQYGGLYREAGFMGSHQA